MDKNLPPAQLAYYKRIDEILFYKWDPIGISDSNWSRDEYQSYLPQVFRLALEHSTAAPIAEYLTQVATEQMGLRSRSEHDRKISELILELKPDTQLTESD